MAARRVTRPHGFEAATDRPLIAVLVEQAGQEMVHYFTDEPEPATAHDPAVLADALATIGAFGDLDWAEMEDALERIPHDTPPTPPITAL